MKIISKFYLQIIFFVLVIIPVIFLFSPQCYIIGNVGFRIWSCNKYLKYLLITIPIIGSIFLLLLNYKKTKPYFGILSARLIP
jgi:hypothetical protein